MILCWKKGSANKKKGFHLFKLGFDVSNFYDEARFFSSLTFTLPSTTLNIHMNAACLPAKHSSTFHEVFPGCWRRSRVVTFIERSGKKFQLKFSKVDNERWRGSRRLRARFVFVPWNNNDVDVLFLRADRQMCNLLALSIAASLRLAKFEQFYTDFASQQTRFSSCFAGVCQKAEQFYTFQCMRDLKSIAHKLHTWPRYFTLNPRYTYCFARRGFSRNKTDSFALP